MDLESWEDSDVDFRSSTPIFTSDDEQYPTVLSTKVASVPPTVKSTVSIVGASTVFDLGRQPRFTGQYVAPIRSSFGQRKQRRFENDFFFSQGSSFTISSLNPTMASLLSQLQAMELEEQVIIVDSIFKQLKQRDRSLLDAFFEGEPIVIKSAKRSNAKLLGDKVESTHKDESVEVALSRVDKRARKHLHRAVEFVKMIEAILFANSQYLDCGSVERFQDKAKVETILLSLSSPFLRMLAHGIAQFYKVSSNTVKTPKGELKVQLCLSKSLRTKGVKLSTYLESRNKQPSA